MKALFIFDKRNFHAGSAQIEEEEILAVDRVDDTGKTEGGFCAPADDRHGNACSHVDTLQEGSTVYSIPYCSSGDSQNLLYLLDFNNMRIYSQAFQRTLLCFFRQETRLLCHAFRKADGFLFLINEFIGSLLSNLHDDEADRVGTQINNSYTVHKISFYSEAAEYMPRTSCILIYFTTDMP